MNGRTLPAQVDELRGASPFRGTWPVPLSVSAPGWDGDIDKLIFFRHLAPQPRIGDWLALPVDTWDPLSG